MPFPGQLCSIKYAIQAFARWKINQHGFLSTEVNDQAAGSSG
jgi:hypothetical protein